MSRPYSDAFLRELFDGTQEGIGFDLARLCVTAKIPSKYVAAALEVTPVTVFNWFRGAGIKDSRHDKIRAFMKLLKEDMDKGVLPVQNMATAKAYIEDMLGHQI